MTSTSSRTRFNQRRQGPGELRFVSFPLRDDGVRGWLTAGLFVAVAVGAGLAAGSAAVGLVIFFALAIAARRLWIPTRYDIGPAGIAETHLGRTRRIAWSQIARYETRGRGVLLSAVADETPLAAVYSQYICAPNNRDELAQLVDFHLRGAHRSLNLSDLPSNSRQRKG